MTIQRISTSRVWFNDIRCNAARDSSRWYTNDSINFYAIELALVALDRENPKSGRLNCPDRTSLSVDRLFGLFLVLLGVIILPRCFHHSEFSQNLHQKNLNCSHKNKLSWIVVTNWNQFVILNCSHIQHSPSWIVVTKAPCSGRPHIMRKFGRKFFVWFFSPGSITYTIMAVFCGAALIAQKLIFRKRIFKKSRNDLEQCCY